MKLPSFPSLQNFGKSPIQWIVLALICVFLVMPVSIPYSVAKLIDSPLGILGLFIAGVSLFMHGHPIVAVAFVIFVYEIIRRSTNRVGMQNNMIEFTPTEKVRDQEMKKMAPKSEKTLEEEVIGQMAPANKGVYIETSFKPVSNDVHQASNL